jgi:hypothetical protein
MSEALVVSAAALERWRRQARELKKERAIPHHAALDAVALETGFFRDWHHLIDAAKATEPTEAAFKAGLVVGVDFKNFEELSSARQGFVEDERIAWFVVADYMKRHRELASETEAQELLVLHVVYFRWHGAIPRSGDEALRLAHRVFGASLLYARLRGARVFDVLSEDDEDV